MSSQKNFIKAMEIWVNTYLFRSFTEYFDYLKTTEVSMLQAYALTFIHYKGPSKISDICEHMMVSAAAADSAAAKRCASRWSSARRSAPPARRCVAKE